MFSHNETRKVIEINGLKKVYNQVGGTNWALKGIDINVLSGEFVGIIGKSGAGKTTLINMIAGLDTVTEGKVRVENSFIHTLKENDLAVWRSKNIGVIYQNFQLMPGLSLLENVMLPLDFAGTYHSSQSQKKARKILEMMELSDHIHKLPSAISGGQQQRVAIARALVNDPALILADEPTGRLDSVTANTIFKVFEELHQQGRTILMVTHDRSQFSRFSRVLWMSDGLITKDSPNGTRK